MSSKLAVPQYKSHNSGRFTVKRGLDGQDENIDVLQKYFNEMQKFTVETSMPADFLSFAACAHYFGIIMSGEDKGLDDCEDEDAEGEPEEDSKAIALPVYPESSRATSPPASTIVSSSSHVGREREIFSDDPYVMLSPLSRYEKVLKWTEAFAAKSEDDEGEPTMLPLQSIDSLEMGGEESSFDKGKGKLSESGPNPIPQFHDISNTEPRSEMDEHPENFINWSDDGMAVDDTSTIYDLYESPRGKMDLDVSKHGPQKNVKKEITPEDGEPETHYAATAPELPEISPGPEVETLIFNAAVEFQDGLWTRRIAEHEEKKARQALPPPSKFVKAGTSLSHTSTQKSKQPQPVGLVYLLASQKYEDPLHMGECTLGFYIAPEYRENHEEQLVEALNVAIKEAFDDQQCHRLQSIIVDNHDKLFSFTLLTACGFRHEGVRRHGFFSPTAQEYRDVFYYAMLATEWVHDSDETSSARLRTSSLWEEILSRHQRERDDLHRLEEKRMRRSNSVETIKQRVNDAVDVDADLSTFSDSGSQYASSGSSLPPSSSSSSSASRKKVVLGTVAQARYKQAGSQSPQGRSSHTGPPVSAESPQSPVRARYETNVPSSSSQKKSRAKRPSGGLTFSSGSSSTASLSDWSSQWDLLDDF